MRKKKQLLIALGVLLILGAAFALLSGKGGDEAPSEAVESAPREIFTLTDLAEDELKAIRIENSLDSYTLLRGEGGYTLRENPSIRMNPQSVSSLAFVICNLKSYEKIEEAAGSTDEYGLSPEPAARVTLSLTDGSEILICIGSSAPSGSGYYTMREGDSAVYLLSSYTASGMLNSLDLLRDRTLPGVDFQNPARVTIGGEREIDIVPYFPYEALSSSLSTLLMVKPYRRPVAVSTQKFSEAMEALATNYRIVSFPAEGTETGIDGGREFYFKDAGERELTIRFGNKTEDGGEIYCRISGLDEDITMPAAAASILDVKPVEMADRFVRLVGIDQVSEMQVTYGDETWTGGIEWLDEEKGEFTFQGESADEKAFKKMYQEVLYLLFEGEIPGSFTPEGEPKFTLKYTGDSDSPGTTTAELYSYDREFYAISIDGFPPEFLIGKYQIEALVNYLRNFKG